VIVVSVRRLTASEQPLWNISEVFVGRTVGEKVGIPTAFGKLSISVNISVTVSENVNVTVSENISVIVSVNINLTSL